MDFKYLLLQVEVSLEQLAFAPCPVSLHANVAAYKSDYVIHLPAAVPPMLLGGITALRGLAQPGL